MRIEITKAQVEEFALFRDKEVGQEYLDLESNVTIRMRDAARRGYMTRQDLVQVASWKWRGGRTSGLCKKNEEADVEETSRVSFAAKSERLKIGSLLALNGVDWPMASVILHFAFPDRYPILDVRVMRTVGGSKYYTFDNWSEYTKLCKEKAAELGIGLRLLDKALWGYDAKKSPFRKRRALAHTS